MLPANLFEFKNQLNQEGILFCYAGPFSQGIIEETGIVLRSKMKLLEAPLTMTKKVFIIFVEQVQNILNYSSEIKLDKATNEEMRSGVVVIGIQDSEFFILSGNLIRISDKENLKKHIESIKNLDKKKLKALYKDKLRKPSNPKSKGAGLGFIDIARKASSPIDYIIQDVDEEYAFFSMKVII